MPRNQPRPAAADAPLWPLLQVCKREPSDKKGGHLARRKKDGRLMLRESAMCPDEDKPQFEDIGRWVCWAHCLPLLVSCGG